MHHGPSLTSTSCVVLGGAAAGVALTLACGGSTASPGAVLASCLVTYDGGAWTYVSCTDFVGSTTADFAQQMCKALGAAGTATYRPAQPCPTDGRVGSCTQGKGTAAEAVQRCYAPLTPDTCRRPCEAFDGGFVPN